MRVFVTGATGLVGTRLVTALRERGYRVTILSRSAKDVEAIRGDPSLPGPWIDTMRECDAVVHLAGENIFARRWNEKFLKLVESSRVVSTVLIAKSIVGSKVRTFLSGSAVGIYGADTGDAIITEDSPAGTDRLARICVAWEQAADPAREAGIRVVHPRLGIVLDQFGGALPKMAKPFRMFAGGKLGAGKQFVSWVHYADVTGILLMALDESSISGPLNVTSPNPITNREFSQQLGKALHRPCWLPTPKWLLRIAVGKAAEIVAGGQRAIPQKAIANRYSFRYPQLDQALIELFSQRSV